jgi:hypothetical protein
MMQSVRGIGSSSHTKKDGVKCKFLAFKRLHKFLLQRQKRTGCAFAQHTLQHKLLQVDCGEKSVVYTHSCPASLLQLA